MRPVIEIVDDLIYLWTSENWHTDYMKALRVEHRRSIIYHRTDPTEPEILVQAELRKLER